MAKRFTDTEKWRDPWYCGLSTDEKIFWGFLLDNCSLAGIWQVNWPLVKFYIPDFEFKEESFKGRIQAINSDKWFIPWFIKLQYGTLQQTNRLHKRVMFELEKEGVSIPLAYPLDTPYIPLGYPLDTPSIPLKYPLNAQNDKEKEKEKERTKEKEKEKENIYIYANPEKTPKDKETEHKDALKVTPPLKGVFKKPTTSEVAAYAASLGFDLNAESFVDFYESKGWVVGKSPMKDWKAAVRNWRRTENSSYSGSTRDVIREVIG